MVLARVPGGTCRSSPGHLSLHQSPNQAQLHFPRIVPPTFFTYFEGSFSGFPPLSYIMKKKHRAGPAGHIGEEEDLGEGGCLVPGSLQQDGTASDSSRWRDRELLGPRGRRAALLPKTTWEQRPGNPNFTSTLQPPPPRLRWEIGFANH